MKKRLKMKTIKKLNRFTSLPVLLDFLERKKLVLLNPESWDDRNDTAAILEYKRRKGIKSIFALCFSHGDETIHHWKTFSDGSSGCCIEFDADGLIKVFESVKNARHGRVIYKKLKTMESKSLSIHRLPFVKRWPYRCEQEYRIIWEGDWTKEFYEIDVPLSLIRKITISQKMPRQIFNTIKSSLKDSFEDPDQRVNLSTVYENKRWIACFKNKK